MPAPARAELESIDARLLDPAVPIDHWKILHRLRLQIERDILGDSEAVSLDRNRKARTQPSQPRGVRVTGRENLPDTADAVRGQAADRPTVAHLLGSWRAAERRWEAMSPDDPALPEAAVEVLRSWLGYHAATDTLKPGEFALVTDDDRRYVAVSDGVTAALGYEPDALHGKRIEDLAAPSLVAGTSERWAAFIRDGRQDGEFDMLRADGRVLRVGYQARAHFPIAGYHLSRLWPL
jgi:PAS domain-containing protein